MSAYVRPTTGRANPGIAMYRGAGGYGSLRGGATRGRPVTPGTHLIGGHDAFFEGNNHGEKEQSDPERA